MLRGMTGAWRGSCIKGRRAHFHNTEGKHLLFKSRVAAVSLMMAGVGAGCYEAPLGSVELGQKQGALCVDGDGSDAALAALAVATAMELGRWQSSKDFVIRDGALALSRTGRRQCADGECWNTRALLDLQYAGSGEVTFGDRPFEGRNYRRRLVKQYKEQERCEARPGRSRVDCPAERHALELESQQTGACDTIFTFKATTPAGGPLQEPAQLANKLVYVGYPENPYLAFTSTGSTVSIDPTYGLNEGGSTSAGSCSAACTQVSSSNISGDCCICNGSLREYSKAAFSQNIYLCR